MTFVNVSALQLIGHDCKRFQFVRTFNGEFRELPINLNHAQINLNRSELLKSFHFLTTEECARKQIKGILLASLPCWSLPGHCIEREDCLKLKTDSRKFG